MDSDPSTKIKRFGDEALSYSIPKLEETDWEAYPDGGILEDLLVHKLETALTKTVAEVSGSIFGGR